MPMSMCMSISIFMHIYPCILNLAPSIFCFNCGTGPTS